MGRHSDYAKIILLILAGMFFPFAVSDIIVYGLSLLIVESFILFLVTFGLELGTVVLIFRLLNKDKSKEIEELRPNYK